MLVDALVVLSDLEANGALLTVRVRGDVQTTYPGAAAQYSFGPFRVVAAALDVPESLGLDPGEGSARDMDRGRELVEEEANVWRVMDSLREALAPFAAEWVALGRNGEEATRLVMPVHVADCKRAKEVLGG